MRDTLVNVLVGAAVTVALTPLLPFAPVVGGGVAGYLGRGSRGDGLRVGALSGGLSVVPVVLLVVAVGNLFLLAVASVDVTAPLSALGGLGAVVVLVGFLFLLVYAVVLGAVGGYLGVYLRERL
jgi:hypothetical protein